MIAKNSQKICFFGQSGVGKSTLVSLLQGKKVNTERKPTIGLEIEDSLLNGQRCAVWDLGGQERFKFMWQDFLKGAGLAVLVTDSTEKNIEETKDICERYARCIGSKIIAIANKQDLPGVLEPEDIQKKLGIRTYGMSAIRTELRERMKDILEYEMNEE
ncbi:MAG: GTP-binding protein [Candidatus Lokiarchaeota archaeon]|nr:GTP-binding protein [Candidatus Lokiarchaeota archaeon]MBD3339246.1 GTP-binding protein [Candidatus Lokiarchaeota archaeon]